MVPSCCAFPPAVIEIVQLKLDLQRANNSGRHAKHDTAASKGSHHSAEIGLERHCHVLVAERPGEQRSRVRGKAGIFVSVRFVGT